MSTTFLLTALSFFFVCGKISGYNGIIEAIPERAQITYINSKYIADNPILTVRKTSRNGKYVVNIGGTIKHTWSNNVSAHIIFYEFLHNEYRRSFIEMHFLLCDLINHDQLIGYALRAIGVVCPLPQGTYYFMNATLSRKDYTYIWPFEKTKVAVSLKLEPHGVILGEAYIIITIKQFPVKATKA